MALIVNLRNMTDLFIKVDGIDETIVPNTALDDRTIEWESDNNKQIKFFSTEDCSGSPVLVSNLVIDQTDGVKVQRGTWSGTPNIVLEASANNITLIQDSNGVEEKLVDWQEVTSETHVSLVFSKS
jgi:hypothetical protein